MNRKLFQSVRLFAFCLWAIGGIHSLRAQSNNAPVLSLAPGVSPALTVTGTPGASYQVQFASKLAASNQWTALTNILLSNSAYLLHDPVTASNAARFYRALLLSAPSNIFNGYAPAQISPGEIYQFTVPDSFGGTTVTQTLFISSATNGIWMGPPNAIPPGGVSAVALNFTRLSDLTIQLDITFPATSSNTPPTTNSYLLAFATASTGVVQGVFSPPAQNVGNFSRMTDLIGLNVTLSPAAGDIWSFSASNGFGAVSVTLVMDSSTSGWWITPGNNPGAGISPATFQFIQQGPLGGTLTVIASSNSPATNTFAVEFTSANSGSFEGSFSSLGQTQGAFHRDSTALSNVGAPQSLTEGEIYQLTISNGNSLILPTLAMESSNAGWLGLQSSTFSGGVNGLFSDTVQYTQLGPLSASLVTVAALNPLSTNLTTNTCLFVYTNTNAGYVLTTLGAISPTSLGLFIRNADSIGQTLAPAQLTTGDSYQMFSTGEQIGTLQTLDVDSPTDGIWLTAVSFPAFNAVDAKLQYTRAGPLSATLTAVYSTSPAPATNVCTLLFTGTNSGLFYGTDSPGSSTVAVGDFSCNPVLEKQTLAPQQMTAGETYQLTITNSGFVSTQTLVVNSFASGLLMVSGTAPGGDGIFPASIQYSSVGTLGANLTLTLPTSTNIYLFDFSSSTGGLVQASIGNSPGTSSGSFVHSTVLVGQSFAPQQLVNGESYQLTSTNQPQSSIQTLILTSPTNGLWAVNGTPNSGIFSASVQYTLLGPLAATVDVILPPGSGLPSGSTNNFTLIFNSATNGVFQNDNSTFSPLPAGTFIHNTP